MKIISVVGARPNFIKISPFIKEIEKYNSLSRNSISHILVHTGQHYDNKMSLNFFNELNIQKPDINLNIGSGSHSEQVGNTMISFEKVLIEKKPDWVVVVGDVNATLACSVAAKKMKIKVCHIESGLRSYDKSMPEEINRLVTDRLSDLLLTPDKFSTDNLIKEGVKENRIVFVGNIMIDTLFNNINKVNNISFKELINNNLVEDQVISNFNYKNNFGIITMHRPSNVDFKNILKPLVDFFINFVGKRMPLIWTVHPRTKKQLIKFKLWDSLLYCKDIIILEPLGYLEMLKLNMHSQIMFTDSGGLQEECTVLGTSCITLRSNTERPITLYENGGVSLLSGNDLNSIKDNFNLLVNKNFKSVKPELWDGKTAKRCLDAILSYN
tara:strand:- start:659 stop:1807 length:1149 start_codon:yes stop_codon:yes gene_type:complete